MRPENPDEEFHSARLSKVLHSAGNDAENQSHMGIGAENPTAGKRSPGTSKLASPQVLPFRLNSKNFLREVFGFQYFD